MPVKKNSIIIVGAGYAGLKALEELATNKNNEIKLFDKNPYHFMQTDVYDLIANEVDFAHVTVDLYTLCSGYCGNASFIKEEVNGIDFNNKKVITKKQRYSYDYLIIAVGARTKFFSNVKGLIEYAYGVKALHRAMYFKQKFEMSLFKKLDQGGRYCHPLTIVVAGGGLSGVEIAAQMASYAKSFYEKNDFLCRRLNIVLVNSGPQILKGLDSTLAHQSQKRLDSLEVVTKNNQKVIEVAENEVTLSDGEKIKMDYMIYAGGVEPNALIHKLNIKKNEHGYIETDEYLKSIEFDNVYAAGDCTTIYYNSKPLAPTADVAEQSGTLCAKNINAIINNKLPKKHKIRPRGILIALGRGYASGRLLGINVVGYLAYIFKKIVEKVYSYGLKRRANKGCDKIFNS